MLPPAKLRYPSGMPRCFFRAFPDSLVQTALMKKFLLTAWLAVVCAAVVIAADGDGFVPLFNGRDLSGWVNANCRPKPERA